MLVNYFVFEDMEDCRFYDFCFRLFYVEMVILKLKDVVFVFDISGLMKGSWLRIVKEVVKIFLSIMNFRDRVSMKKSFCI